MPTRFEAKNTSSSKSHTFSYVSGSFDLNDGSDNRLVGCDSFRNNVSPLEKQRAFLADKGLEISREAFGVGVAVAAGVGVGCGFARESVRVNVPSPASIVRAPPIASTLMVPSTPFCCSFFGARAKVTLSWQDNVAITGDGPGAPPVTVRPLSVKSTDSAPKVTEPPSGLPSVICMSSMCLSEIVGEFEVPDGMAAKSPLSGTPLGSNSRDSPSGYRLRLSRYRWDLSDDPKESNASGVVYTTYDRGVVTGIRVALITDSF